MRILIVVFLAYLCFSQNQQKVNLHINIIGNGVVTHSGGEYPKGEMITITPIEEERNLFSHWSGQLFGAKIEGGNITLPMEQSRSITANFKSRGQLTFTFDPFLGIDADSGVGIYKKYNIVLWKLKPFVFISDEYRFRLKGEKSGTLFLKEDMRLKKEWIEQYRVRVITEINGSKENKDFWVDKNNNFNYKAGDHLQEYNFKGWFYNDKFLSQNLNYDIKVDKPIVLVRKFTKNFVSLRINSKLGDVYGQGTFKAGKEVSWSLKETIVYDKVNKELRHQAEKKEGKFKIFRDTVIDIKWYKYYRVNVVKNDNIKTFRATQKNSDWAKEGTELVFFAEPEKGTRFLAWDIDGKKYEQNPLRLEIDKQYEIKVLSHSNDFEMVLPDSKETLHLNFEKLNTIKSKSTLNRLKQKNVFLELQGIKPLVKEYFLDISTIKFKGKQAIRLANRYLDFVFSPKDVRILHLARSKNFNLSRISVKDSQNFFLDLGEKKIDEWEYLYSKNTPYGVKIFYKIFNNIYATINFELKKKALLVSVEYIHNRLEWVQPNFFVNFKKTNNIGSRIIDNLQVDYKGEFFAREFLFGNLNTSLLDDKLFFELFLDNAPYVLALKSDNVDINFMSGHFHFKILDTLLNSKSSEEFNIIMENIEEPKLKVIGELNNQLYITQSFLLYVD